MSARRWTLALLAALAAAAGLFYSTHEPAEPLPPPTQNEAALLKLLPLATPEVPISASSAAAAAASPAPQSMPSSSVPPAASAPRIGSEGYGPHIERAHAGTDAAAAWEAVQWLRNCASNEARRHSFEQVRNQGVVPEMMTQLMVEADAEARRCQTVTAQHRAMLPELAAQAMRAGMAEAASAYAHAVFPGNLTAGQREEVADAMRRDAREGHALSLFGAALAHEAWGLSDTERAAYLAAYKLLQTGGNEMTESLVRQGVIHFKAPLKPEQLAAAKMAAQEIVDRVRAGKQP